MAKALRQSLEAKLAALDDAEWDSDVSMSDAPGESDCDDDIQIAPVPSDKKKTKSHENKSDEPSALSAGPTRGLSGVIYIGHIPRGFYEEGMQGFFSQFGRVVRLRLARSKKSGRYKGYGFVEFALPEVACTVAETMNGYFLSEKQLVCRVLSFDEIHPDLFHRAGRPFCHVKWHGLRRKKFNADRTLEQMNKQSASLVRKEQAKREKLAALGIEYEFPGYKAAEEKHQAELVAREANRARLREELRKSRAEALAKKRKADEDGSVATVPKRNSDEVSAPADVRKDTTKDGASASKKAKSTLNQAASNAEHKKDQREGVSVKKTSATKAVGTKKGDGKATSKKSEGNTETSHKDEDVVQPARKMDVQSVKKAARSTLAEVIANKSGRQSDIKAVKPTSKAKPLLAHIDEMRVDSALLAISSENNAETKVKRGSGNLKEKAKASSKSKLPWKMKVVVEDDPEGSATSSKKARGEVDHEGEDAKGQGKMNKTKSEQRTESVIESDSAPSESSGAVRQKGPLHVEGTTKTKGKTSAEAPQSSDSPKDASSSANATRTNSKAVEGKLVPAKRKVSAESETLVQAQSSSKVSSKVPPGPTSKGNAKKQLKKLGKASAVNEALETLEVPAGVTKSANRSVAAVDSKASKSVENIKGQESHPGLRATTKMSTSTGRGAGQVSSRAKNGTKKTQRPKSEKRQK